MDWVQRAPAADMAHIAQLPRANRDGEHARTEAHVTALMVELVRGAV